MLNAIREFFDQHVAAGATGGDERHTIELATAALLVETVRLDGEIDGRSRGRTPCGALQFGPARRRSRR
jgi:hypothetical protein